MVIELCNRIVDIQCTEHISGHSTAHSKACSNMLYTLGCRELLVAMPLFCVVLYATLTCGIQCQLIL